MRIEIGFERGERWRVADFCGKRFPNCTCLKLERSVSSRFKVSFGDFQQIFAAGSKNSRGLGGVKQFWENIIKVRQSSAHGLQPGASVVLFLFLLFFFSFFFLFFSRR